MEYIKWIDPRDSDPAFLWGKFPEGFLWGTSTAAGQIEGGCNEDGNLQIIFEIDSLIKFQNT